MDLHRRREWETLAWVVFVLAFVAVGSVPFDMLPRRNAVRSQSPANSADYYYESNLQLADGHQRIDETLRQIPAGTRVAVLYREGTAAGLCAGLICIACWIHGLVPFDLPGNEREAERICRDVGAGVAISLHGGPLPWFEKPAVLSPQVCWARLTPSAP
jgi:hypothetical protein